MDVPRFRNANLLVVFGTVALVAAVYFPSALALAGYWTDPNMEMQHGVLVLLLSVWLLLRSRDALAAAPVQPSPWALPAVVVSSAAALVFWRAGIQSLQLLLLPVLALSAVLAALGPRAMRVVAFPVAYLYFALPGWTYLVPALQDITARVVGMLLPAMGIRVQLAGHIVNLPGGGTFEITPACSGIHFLVVGLAVAALLGELEQATARRRAGLLAAMAAVAVVSNWARAALIIAIGYSTDMRHLWATRDHVLFGWVIFAGVLIAFVWLTPLGAAPRASPPNTAPESNPPPRALGRALAMLAAALVAAPAAAYTAAALAPADAVAPATPAAAPASAAWRGPFPAVDPEWQPIFVGAHSEWHSRYEDAAAGRAVEVLAIGYARQEQGRELVNGDNSLLGDRGLILLGGSVATLGGHSYREWIVTDRRGRRSLVWSLYDIGGRTFVTPLYSQLWYAMHAFGRPPYSALFAFRVACDPSCPAARDTLSRFLETLGADLFGSLHEEQGVRDRQESQHP